MRISPVGWIAKSEDELKTLSKAITEISHNHPEGIKGAEAVAMGVYLARIGCDKDEIRRRLAEYYPELLSKYFTVDRLRTSYGYDEAGDWVTCQGSVPQAIVCFLDGSGFEDAVRNAISIGGDSDTIGAMAGSIAEAYYGIPDAIKNSIMKYLPSEVYEIYKSFEKLQTAAGKR